MSEFAPPPPPPGAPDHYDPAFPQAPQPWSGLAITAFIFSFLGCALLPAILGIIFGIAGIVATGDNRRRGRGLAVAAIPISIVTGCLSFCIIIPGVYIYAAGRTVAMLPKVFSVQGSSLAEATTMFREITTDDFDQNVPDEQFQQWLKQVREKHGTLATVEDVQPDQTASTGDRAVVNVRGKFTNGPANIRVTLEVKGWSLRIDDIAIEGLSPRTGNAGG